MKKYIVKSGQNLFDVALAIYGSIEGVFDLLVSNPDVNGQALSFDVLLSAGTELNYNEEYTINSDIRDWLSVNKIKVANGEHVFQNANISESISNALDKYNNEVLSIANNLYPGVYDNGIVNGSSVTLQKLFMTYVLQNYIGSGHSDLEILAEKIANNKVISKSTDADEFFANSISSTRMIIQQSGVVSSISAKIFPKRIIAIDWGDSNNLDIFVNCQEEKLFEHCYNDDGNHIITVYGNFDCESLDLTSVHGIYYMTSTLKVTKTFSSNYPDNNTLNKLIEIGNE